MPTAPIHHEGSSLDDGAVAAMVEEVRASAVRATTASLNELAEDVAHPVTSLSLRAWPADFPRDIKTQRRVPYESRADSVMYRQVLAECAKARKWTLATFDAKTVEAAAADVLGGSAGDLLQRPRAELGPPWTKDHRLAFAATIVASSG